MYHNPFFRLGHFPPFFFLFAFLPPCLSFFSFFFFLSFFFSFSHPAPYSSLFSSSFSSSFSSVVRPKGSGLPWNWNWKCSLARLARSLVQQPPTADHRPPTKLALPTRSSHPLFPISRSSRSSHYSIYPSVPHPSSFPLLFARPSPPWLHPVATSGRSHLRLPISHHPVPRSSQSFRSILSRSLVLLISPTCAPCARTFALVYCAHVLLHCSHLVHLVISAV